MTWATLLARARALWAAIRWAKRQRSRSRTVWIVLSVADIDDAAAGVADTVVGVFTSKGRAVAIAMRGDHMVGPLTLDRDYGDAVIDWPEAWYPAVEPEPCRRGAAS